MVIPAFCFPLRPIINSQRSRSAEKVTSLPECSCLTTSCRSVGLCRLSQPLTSRKPPKNARNTEIAPSSSGDRKESRWETASADISGKSPNTIWRNVRKRFQLSRLPRVCRQSRQTCGTVFAHRRRLIRAGVLRPFILTGPSPELRRSEANFPVNQE